MERAFMSPVGPWFRWFAWHPVHTDDRGWRWLRLVWRRRMQTHDYLSGPTLQGWQCIVDTGLVKADVDDPEPAPEPTPEQPCRRCDSAACPGGNDIVDCTAVIDHMTARQQARAFLMIECGLRCLDCGGFTRSTPDGGWCLTCRRHVFVVSRDFAPRRSA